jgi:hypothetical protein
MNIIINKNTNIENNQPKIYDLGQIDTSLQDLLDSSSIFIESDQLVILKVINLNDTVSYYLLTIPDYINGQGVYGIGKNITTNDLIVLNSGSSGDGLFLAIDGSNANTTVNLGEENLVANQIKTRNSDTTPITMGKNNLDNNESGIYHTPSNKKLSSYNNVTKDYEYANGAIWHNEFAGRTILVAENYVGIQAVTFQVDVPLPDLGKPCSMFVSGQNVLIKQEGTTTEILNILEPVRGLMIYNATINAFVYYNGTSWQRISTTNM